MQRTRIPEESIPSKLKELPPGWSRKGDLLYKEFVFPDFIKAFAFLTEVAIHSQVLDHHPRIVNTYNRVQLELWTHDVGGISEFDIELAKRIG